MQVTMALAIAFDLRSPVRKLAHHFSSPIHLGLSFDRNDLAKQALACLRLGPAKSKLAFGCEW